LKAQFEEVRKGSSFAISRHGIYEGLTINVFVLHGQAINVGVGVAGFDTIGKTWGSASMSV
jgi:hypothetical protein